MYGGEISVYGGAYTNEDGQLFYCEDEPIGFPVNTDILSIGKKSDKNIRKIGRDKCSFYDFSL